MNSGYRLSFLVVLLCIVQSAGFTFWWKNLRFHTQQFHQVTPSSRTICEPLSPGEVQKQHADMELVESIIQKQYKQPQSREQLLSPADIQFISSVVDERAAARARGDYIFADELRIYLESICTHSTIDSVHFNTSGFVSENSVSINESIHHRSAFNRTMIRSWPKGYSLAINDIPRRLGGGSTWEMVLNNGVSSSLHEDDLENIDLDFSDHSKATSVLSYAHQALGLSVSASKRNQCVENHELQRLVQSAKQRILVSGLEDLRGRKAADAAFWFAFAGVLDENEEIHQQERCKNKTLSEVTLNLTNRTEPNTHFSLFTALTCFCIHELQRFGKRSSCDVKYIVQMVERIAVAGIQGPVTEKLWKVAAECIDYKSKNESMIQVLESSGMLQSLRDATFSLHSPRSLLWIWRFASRQRKQRAFLDTASKHWDVQLATTTNNTSSAHYLNEKTRKPHEESSVMCWSDIFHDPTLPLVVDIGCGMGVSLLGLSTISPFDLSPNRTLSQFPIDINWSHCNFIGADLSRLAVGYATSIAKRWGIHQKRVYFSVDHAESIMNKIKDSYPGEVVLTMINFPTPFRLQCHTKETETDEGIWDYSTPLSRGNSQLPDISQGFMVTESLLKQIKVTMTRRTISMTNDHPSRYLLMQSNCEDVAVYMKNLVSQQGMDLISIEGDASSEPHDNRIPKRTQQWIRLGGERATGSHFSKRMLIPPRGATETEVACVEKSTPVYRFAAMMHTAMKDLDELT